MLFKLFIVCLAAAGVLWWMGYDFQSAKDSVTGAAQGNAESMTGRAAD